MKLAFLIIVTVLIAFILIIWVSGRVAPSSLGVREGKLSPCPERPNCVSSQSKSVEHHIDPLNVKGIEHPLKVIKSIVLSVPRSTIVADSGPYIHVTFRSKVFSFVDDTEFYYDKEQEIVHVRSAARLGYSDLGVNRKRVEWIRSELSQHKPR